MLSKNASVTTSNTSSAHLGAVAVILILLGIGLGSFITSRIAYNKGADAAAESIFDMVGKSLDPSGRGLWAWNVEENTVFWDDRLSEIYGVESVLTYDDWLVTVHPDDRVRANAICTAAAEMKQSYRMKFRIIRPDGTEALIQESATTSADGRLVVGVNTILEELVIPYERREKVE